MSIKVPWPKIDSYFQCVSVLVHEYYFININLVLSN